MSYVTGHTYYLKKQNGKDADNLSISVEPWLWEDPANESIDFVLPHKGEREVIEFRTDVSGLIANNTLNTLPESEWVMGTHVHYNDTET